MDGFENHDARHMKTSAKLRQQPPNKDTEYNYLALSAMMPNRLTKLLWNRFESFWDRDRLCILVHYY